jgi:GDP-L-fucose synthase
MSNSINANSRIYVAGHRGLAGAAIVRRLQAEGLDNLILRTHSELDLKDQAAVRSFFEQEHPEYVFVAAAKVGGILANSTRPAEFIYDNLQIQNNIIDSAWRSGVKKLLFLGSSCIYPRNAPQPIKEEYLLSGALEESNQWYAIAKIAGIRMCQAYRRQYGFNAIAAMPTNLYGPGDNFDLTTSHVLPALIRKFHEATLQSRPTVEVWGTGAPRREFLHVDDLADALLHLMRHYDEEQHINVGVGSDISIRELAELIQGVTGYQGKILWDETKPDGTPRKVMDVSRIHALGWQARVSLNEGVRDTWEWYREQFTQK